MPSIVPRKTPVPEIERAIGRRLRQFREEKLISQTAFAAKLQISRAQLINYEEGFAPMPWIVGLRLNRFFDLNPRWLATGKLHQSLKIKLAEVNPEHFSARAPFSKVYNLHWKESVETESLLSVTFGFDPNSVDKADKTHVEILELAAMGWLLRVPKDRFREFYLDLSAEAERIIRKMNSQDTGPLPRQW